MRTLVAGMGNVLRADDGFGVAVVKALARDSLGSDVTVEEYGIAGISLVQTLMTGYDALIVVDAMRRGGVPGTVYVLEAQVPDVKTLPARERRDYIADMHWTEPGRALVLSKALGVLPPRVYLVGCEPEVTDDFGFQLGSTVAEAVPRAATVVRRLVRLVRAAERLRLPVFEEGRCRNCRQVSVIG